MRTERANKPNSVVQLRLPVAGRRSFISAACCQVALAPYPQLGRGGPPLAAYLGLLAVGFALPSPSPVTRCALAAPFHPYRRHAACGFGWGCRPRSVKRRLHERASPCVHRSLARHADGGVVSVALSRGSLRVAVSDHRALPSSDFPPGRRLSVDRATASPAPSAEDYNQVGGGKPHVLDRGRSSAWVFAEAGRLGAGRKPSSWHEGSGSHGGRLS